MGGSPGRNLRSKEGNETRIGLGLGMGEVRLQVQKNQKEFENISECGTKEKAPQE
jgi:hypothetical protein